MDGQFAPNTGGQFGPKKGGQFARNFQIRDYGKESHCKGSNDTYGMDGWYAMGQAYAYLGAEIGITINGNNYEILEGSAAAVMQTKLPNPAWFRGYVYGEYDLLGGVYHDNFDFKVELGSTCEVEYGAPELDELKQYDSKVIEYITPQHDEIGVDVFSKARISFNTPLDSIIEYEDGRGLVKYRFKMDEFKLMYGSNNASLAGTFKLNSDKKSGVFTPLDTLPADTTITVRAIVSLYELKGENDTKVMYKGNPIDDTMIVIFKTGPLPDKISRDNIARSYPVIDQKSYYIGESTSGYLKLIRNQNWIFNSEYKYPIVFKSANRTFKAITLLSSDKKTIFFTTPELYTDEYYNVNLLKVADSVYNDTLDANIYLNDSNTSIIFTYDIKTSVYETLAEKIADINYVSANIERPVENSDIVLLGANIDNIEPFDAVELKGNSFSGGNSLISAKARVMDESYFQSKIFPMIYVFIDSAADFRPGYAEHKYAALNNITPLAQYQSAVSDGNNGQYVQTTFPYSYDVVAGYKKAFVDLRYEIINRYIGTSQLNKYSILVLGDFPIFSKGSYECTLQYILPDGQLGSSGIFIFKNPLEKKQN